MALAPPVTLTVDVVDGTELCIDVFAPESAPSGGALLWFHGGALSLGNRSDVPEFLVEAALADGIVVLSADYRLAPQASMADIAHDIRTALQWTRTEGAMRFGIDPARVMVAGESAGGYLAILLGTMEPRPAAVLAFYGYGTLDSPWYMEPSEHYRSLLDLVTESEAMDVIGDHVVTNGREREDRWKFYLYCRQQGVWPKLTAGFDPETQADDLRAYSPTYHVTPDYPPTLLVHGTDDHDVPYAESVQFEAALEAAGVEHELVGLEGVDHGFVGAEVPDEHPSRRPGARTDPAAIEPGRAAGVAFVRAKLGRQA